MDHTYITRFIEIPQPFYQLVLCLSGKEQRDICFICWLMDLEWVLFLYFLLICPFHFGAFHQWHGLNHIVLKYIHREILFKISFILIEVHLKHSKQNNKENSTYRCFWFIVVAQDTILHLHPAFLPFLDLPSLDIQESSPQHLHTIISIVPYGTHLGQQDSKAACVLFLLYCGFLLNSHFFGITHMLAFINEGVKKETGVWGWRNMI